MNTSEKQKKMAYLEAAIADGMHRLIDKSRMWDGPDLERRVTELANPNLTYKEGDIDNLLLSISENDFQSLNPDDKALVYAGWAFVWGVSLPDYIERYKIDLDNRIKRLEEITPLENLAIGLWFIDTDEF